jgi:predicted nucleic acid-binding Zn ribbon protein
MRHRRAPRPIGGAIDQVIERIAPATPLAAVQRAWPGAVGEAIAREAAPVAERAGVITVRCRSATWAQELDLMQDQLLSSLREALGDAAPKRLRFTAG